MPRVHHRKARKDYPANGIAKGDMYFYAKVKTGPRSGYVIRSRTRPKASQLTSSPFKGAMYGIMESWEDDRSVENVSALADNLRDVGSEEQDKFDNMPEGLQMGDTGLLLEARASACEDAATELDDIASDVEGWEKEISDLEDPDEPTPLDPDPTDEEQAEYDADYAGWEMACEEVDAERDDLRQQIDDRLDEVYDHLDAALEAEG